VSNNEGQAFGQHEYYMLEVDAKRMDKSSKSSWNQLELAWISLNNRRIGRYNQHMLLFSFQFVLFLVALTIASFGLLFPLAAPLGFAMVAHSIKDMAVMGALRWVYRACGYGENKNDIPQWNQFALAWNALQYKRRPYDYTHRLFFGGVAMLVVGLIAMPVLLPITLGLWVIVPAMGGLLTAQALDNMFMFWLVKNGTNIMRTFHHHVIESYQDHVRLMRTPEAEARAGLIPFNRPAETVAHHDDH
jgi:hypothetical protein